MINLFETALKKLLENSALSIVALLSLSAMVPVQAHYLPPQDAGLVPIRAFPTNDDVCQLIKPVKKMAKHKRNGKRLIACPTHEKGAIADRKAIGAKVLDKVEHWTILRIR